MLFIIGSREWIERTRLRARVLGMAVPGALPALNASPPQPDTL